MVHDRTGDLVDDVDQALVDEHDVQCLDGWLGEDWHGRPVPCPVCRPHVAAARRRLDRHLLGPGRRVS